MTIADFLSPDDVLGAVAAKDKHQLLQALSERAAPAVHLPSDVISREILKREALGSTGVGRGIALPHARIAGLGEPFGIFARLKKAIDFDAVDGRPVDLVFLLLLPTGQGESQASALALVARKLRDPKILGALRHDRDQAAMYRALTDGETR